MFAVVYASTSSLNSFTYTSHLCRTIRDLTTNAATVENQLKSELEKQKRLTELYKEANESEKARNDELRTVSEREYRVRGSV